MTDRLLDRLRIAEARLVAHSEAGLPPGLTDPDPGASERWEAGQVWAHLAEFPPFWLAQIRAVLAAAAGGTPEPIPFGRTKADPERIAAIERDRRTVPAELLRRVRAGIAEAAQALGELPEGAWAVRGSHSIRGEMPVERITEQFLVEHLEEHADQLDALRADQPTDP